jgi:inner membrane protein
MGSKLMTDMFNPPRPRAARPIGRGADWGGKALLVCALAVLMAIPGLFVFGLVADREHRASTVAAEISALQGGAQQVLGPVLVAPYQIPADAKTAPVNGWYVVSPEQGQVAVKVHGSSLHRGIFDVPVYEATADVDARFGPPPKAVNLPASASIDWSRAKVVVGFSDLRGAKADITGTFAGPGGTTALAFTPSSDVNLGAPAAEPRQPGLFAGAPAANSGFGLITAPAAAIMGSPTGGDFKVALRFTGAERLSVMPFAKSTTVKVAGDWRSPSFDGGFLPETRQTRGDSFSASWSVPFIARGLADHAADDSLSLSALGGKDLGVTFVPGNNPYQSVMRALKYAVMFVGLVFMTFFVFEALSGRRLHPAQYVLIGLAQMVFYLLLLSLSEYIGFDLAFAAAAVATVGLIGLYAGAAFRSGLYRAQALAIFAAIYGLIYLLMRLEDFALLAGSLASFVGLAAAMYLTRDIDWYGGRAEAPAVTPPAA